MKLGFENKRNTIVLGVLGLGLALAMYSSFFAGPPTSSSTSTSVRSAAPATADSSADEPSTPRSPSGHARVDEFQPMLHKKHAEKALDPLTVDPTLRLDLLAKLDNVPAAGGGRDLFSFGKPAPTTLAGTEPIIQTKPYVPIGPRYTPPPPKPTTPPPPPPPPITLKYYGICTTRADGFKTAFFMDGEDILIEAEGATFKGRYRLLRIGVNSAVVEDMQYKHEQTLPLADDALPGAGE